MKNHFNGADYRERIGLTENIAVSETSFEAVHRAQVFTMPFENLDIHLGRGINVSPEAIYDKTVTQIRGGYCFELNGIFLQALTHYGFDARALLARVHITGTPGGRTHQISLVSLNGRQWIADVGFGFASLHQPMPFELDQISNQDGQEYRLIQVEPWGTMMQLKMKGEWQNLYSFDLEHVCQGDIETANHYTSTSPDTHFTKIRVASLVNPTGRVSLSDQTLTRVDGDQSTQEEMPTGAAYIAAIETNFGIRLGAKPEDFR